MEFTVFLLGRGKRNRLGGVDQYDFSIGGGGGSSEGGKNVSESGFARSNS